MCGIAGLLSPNRRWREADLHRLTRSLKHRGPDTEGFYTDTEAGIYLGHRRLSILDLSEAANQPMTSQNGRWVMVYNGEVYNYADIARDLQLNLRTRSDSEVMIEAISREGLQATKRFNGMFALAIYDRHSRELHLLRDPVGIKPLVYFHDEATGNFAFASELKALLALGIPREINAAAVADYLRYEYVPGTQSILSNVRKLAPGAHLTVALDGRLQHGQYAVLTDYLGRATSHRSEAEQLEAFEEILKASLRRQQAADVPVGAFLSGGTDSSLVVTAYQQVSAEPVRTFTIGFDEATHDETPFAEAVASHLGTRHQTLRLPAEDGIRRAQTLPHHFDEPFAVGSAIPSLAVCELARQHVRVALAGDGGDELFMGYGTYAWQRRLARLHRAPAALRRVLLGALPALQAVVGVRQQRALRVVEASLGNNASTWSNTWPAVWGQEQYMFNEREVHALLGHTQSSHVQQFSWDQIRARDLSPWEALALFDLTTYLPQDLMYKMDIASMAYGLEVRVPLLDLEVIKFALQLPEPLRRDRHSAKVLMKRVLERHLPQNLVHRRKWGFPAPVGHWLMGPMAHWLDHYLSIPALTRFGLLHAPTVQQVVQEFRGGKTHHYKRLWALIMLQQWLEHTFDRPHDHAGQP